MTDKIVVFSTCESSDEAKKIGRALVEGRMAACVNVVSGVHSIYRWKGAVEDASECLLVIKTTRERLGQLREEIRRLHSYEVPEVIALPVVDGLDNYLNWIEESVR